MTKRLLGAGIGVAAAALLLTGCGSEAVLASASDVSLTGDAPLCVAAGNGNLCQVRVYFVNDSATELSLDPRTLAFRDALGVQYAGVTSDDLTSLTLPASGRTLTLWSVPLPPGKVPAEAIWTDADKNIVRVTLGASGSPSPSATSATSASPTPSPTPTTASPTPTPTPSSPKPTPTPSSPKPKPTKSTSTPPPGGSIG
ncbi:MAG: hypothetical protein AB7I24_07410 [Candidatus Nanopelagicales bacterium]